MHFRPLATLSTLAIVSLLSTSTVLAQSALPASPSVSADTSVDATKSVALDTVIVKSPKNAAVMPYDDAYVRLKRMQDSKLDRVRLQIKVAPTREDLKLSDVRVAIVNDSTSVNLPISADGVIEVPVLADLYKTNAEIRSNQPKGSLTASVNLGVGWPGGNEITYADVEETVRQMQVAGRDIMGWFAYMLFFPSFANFEVPVQFPVPRGQTMKVMKDGRVVETYTADDKGLLKFRLKREWSALQPTLVFSETMPKQ